MKSKALILPGIGNSGPDHWQSHWEGADPGFRRVGQRDWDHPLCEEWCAALEAAVAEAGAATLLVAHSLACLQVVHWASRTRRAVKGALLVAPPDPVGPNFPKAAIGFAPVPWEPLRFPSIVVASSNDPYGGVAFAEICARAWGSRLEAVGALGHINSESRLGLWREGLALYHQLAA